MPTYVPGLARVLSPQQIPDSEIDAVKAALARADSGRFYSMFPASTPKTARNAGPRSSDRTDSMARLYIHGHGPDLQDHNLAASIGNLFTGGVTLDRTPYGGETSATGLGYFDFLLGSWAINYVEREQAVDTISDNTVIFYSGQSAPVGQASGAFLNTYQDDQNVWFHYAYMECLRGSRLASRGQIASLLCDSFRYDGYLSNLSVQTQATVQNAVMFNFTFRVKQISVVTPVLYSAAAVAEVWSARQDPLIATAPVTEDSTTRTAAQAAVNPVSAAALPAAVAAAEANTRDARATPESGTAPPSVAGQAVDQQIATETVARSAATVDASVGATLHAEGATAASGDMAQAVVPPNVAPDTVTSPDQDLVNRIASANGVQLGGGTVLERDPNSGRFLATTGGNRPVIDVEGAVTVSAGRSADRIAAAAQGVTARGPVYGQSYAEAPSTLPAYAQSGSGLPGGFTDIYRVQGTVFAEAYARAATAVATAQAASGPLRRDSVGRRSRRRRGSSLAA